MLSNRRNEKPAKITIAVNLMYAVVTIGILRTGMTVVRHLDVRTPYFYVGTKLGVYVVSLYLIYQISKGCNWARWALMVVFAAAIPLAVLPAFDSIEHNPVHAILGFLQLGAFIFAVIFLFQKPSSDWFNSLKSSD